MQRAFLNSLSRLSAHRFVNLSLLTLRFTNPHRNMSHQLIHVGAEGGATSVLTLTTAPIPTVTEPFDVLVKIKGVALNPVDTKVRSGAKVGRVLGYDASGIVEAAGPSALFKKGDEVFYAGAIGRAGSNAQYQLVDSRIIAKKPTTLAWDEAAALPLVGLTAWEMYEDKFGLKPYTDNSNEVLVIINGAGGVGTMAIALASKVINIRPPCLIYAFLTSSCTGLRHQEDHCHRVPSRDHRVGKEVRCD
jgi:D-arabinose 1-dehydrogenase-like Zn-dependent alcohol dehydrogenase